MVGVRRSSIRASGKTEVQLDGLVVGVLLEPLSPGLEGEVSVVVVELSDTSASGAVGSVVELSEDHVEVSTLDGIGKTGIRDNALGSSGDEEVLVDALELVDEVGVVGLDTICGHLRSIGLEVEVESVHDSVAERTRSIFLGPLCGNRSKSAHEELSEVLGNWLIGKVVVWRVASTKRKQHLLIVLLAKLDTLVDGRTCLQEKFILAWVGRVLVVVPASVTEVCPRVVSDLLGEAIDKTDVDNINGWISADPGERSLVRSLSPVHDHISRGVSIESC